MSISQNNARTIKKQGDSVKYPKDQGRYSLHINIGWTFSNDPKNLPSGQYTLRITGKDKNSTITQTVHDGKNNRFDNGKIVIDRALKCLTGEGELVIRLTDGTVYRAKVNLGGLPNIATPDGLARRLTNLGFYAGTDTKGKCNPRMAWAIRAFKRVKMNNFTRNKNEVENSRATKKFLEAVQAVYGAHPNDNITEDLDLTQVSTPVSYCGMFGKYVLRRGSFETKGQKDDIDQGPGQTGIWEGVSAVDKTKDPKDYEPIAGEYTVYLRAFDPNEPKIDPKTNKKIPFTKIEPFSNRINLPQPIHMAQFVLFELGYWLVGGEIKDADWVTVGTTQTRNKFIPNGKFDRYTQWAVREFQCHAKFPNAAKENVASKGQLYMRRAFSATAADKPLCGVSGSDEERLEENKYGKNWHFFYRFLMATRTSTDLHHVMWDFTRIRIRDILNKTFTISDQERRVGDYIISEKGVAMLLRWHIYRPGHLFRPRRKDPKKKVVIQENHLLKVLETVISSNPEANQAREDAFLQQLKVIGGPKTNKHLEEIYGWANIPQRGLRSYYKLELDKPTLSSDLNSFKFEAP